MAEPNLESVLLECATDLAGELSPAAVAVTTGKAVSRLPGALVGGLCVVDQERGIADRYTAFGPPAILPADRPPPLIEETTVGESGLGLIGPESGAPLILDLTDENRPNHYDHLRGLGVRRLVTVPMRLGSRLLGSIWMGFNCSEPMTPHAQPFLENVAQLVSSVLWSCQTYARFASGDKRRDTLIELAKVINGSLKLDEVIHSVHSVIGELPGVCTSRIHLLDEDGQSYRCYAPAESTSECDGPPTKPRTIPLADTATARVVEREVTHVSDDLAQQREFAEDAKLHQAGVRRYALSPMVVRDQLLGGLLIASTDSHPMQKVDLWVYENVALQLGLAISNAIQHERLQRFSDRLRQQTVYLREEIQSTHDFGEMIGESAVMHRLRQAIAQVAATDATVLITGETGVGKELVARAIHAHSNRSDHPLVKVNCPAIPEGMVESELFGHERGAFTSAVERRVGRFELAHDGTLFLDEIGELSLPVQAKLLRVLQDGEFERVGGSKTLSSNARIIAATNRDLQQAIAQGIFRSDLFYRLNVFPLSVPSLAERREDIPLLVEAFVARLSRQMGKPIERIDAESLARLTDRDWPGNIRELMHTVERATILCDGPILSIATGEPAPRPAVPATNEPSQHALPTLKDLEAEHICRALEACQGVIEGPRGAAQLLGLKPSTLRFRMNRLGIARRG